MKRRNLTAPYDETKHRVRTYEMDSPQGSFVKDDRIGLVSRDLKSVLDGGPALDEMMRTYRLVAAAGDQIIERILSKE